MSESAAPIRCDIVRLLIDERHDNQLVVLRERDGGRRLGIGIGPLEAMAINRALQQEPFPRPLTHDLLRTIIDELGARCSGIRIRAMEAHTFYAELVVTDASGAEHRFDCRPSDALALAARDQDIPIHVADVLLEEH